MYTLSETQLASVQNLESKLDDSMIKARIQNWLGKIDPQRVLSEQLEEFVGFATHLPAEFQNYPQAFAFSVKNGDEMNEPTESPKEPKAKQTAKPAVKKPVAKTTKKK